VNPRRPDDKLPYRGAWLMVGPEMIHLMELPNPDPVAPEARPAHGGRDRHFCIGVDEGGIAELMRNLDDAGAGRDAQGLLAQVGCVRSCRSRRGARTWQTVRMEFATVALQPSTLLGVEYTASQSGRPAIFFRDPDMNCVEAAEVSTHWR